MPTLYTIGYDGRPLSEFMDALREAGVDAIIDIRIIPSYEGAGYAEQNDLAYMLREGFHIHYEHHPELAPTEELLDRTHQDHDWPAYVEDFTQLLAERPTQQVGQDILARYRTPCLLCFERTADQCHRRLVAEHWAAHLPDVTIQHL